jgi:hypothetical protein
MDEHNGFSYLTVFPPSSTAFLQDPFRQDSTDLASTNCSRLDHSFEQPRPYRTHSTGSITDHDTQNMSEEATQNFEDDLKQQE